MSKTKTKVESEKWYKLIEIVELGLFPWCKNIKTVRNWVHRDKIGKNILKANIVGTGREARYHIQGKNIAEFVGAIEAGNYLN
jgi:hypothetical protein